MVRRVSMFLLGLGGGLALGWLVARLLTPVSGQRLRKEAQEYYDQLLEEARAAAEARRKELEMELKTLTGQAEAQPGA